jgi:hypothetical protein
MPKVGDRIVHQRHGVLAAGGRVKPDHMDPPLATLPLQFPQVGDGPAMLPKPIRT